MTIAMTADVSRPRGLGHGAAGQWAGRAGHREQAPGDRHEEQAHEQGGHRWAGLLGRGLVIVTVLHRRAADCCERGGAAHHPAGPHWPQDRGGGPGTPGG